MWWAPDDSSTALRIPLWGGLRRVPAAFADTVGQDPNAAVAYAVPASAFNFNIDHAFWVWNLVAQFTYGERAMEGSALVQKEIARLQPQLIEAAINAEAGFVNLYTLDPAAALEQITLFAETTAANALLEWRGVWQQLVSHFRDGFSVQPSTKKQCVPKSGNYVGCTSRLDPDAAEQGYPADWYARIVADSDNAQHLLYPVSADPRAANIEKRKLARLSKHRP